MARQEDQTAPETRAQTLPGGCETGQSPLISIFFSFFNTIDEPLTEKMQHLGFDRPYTYKKRVYTMSEYP